MTDISKHDCKEERECRNSEEPWVDFSVSGYAVGVNNHLEGGCDIVELEISWRLNIIRGFGWLQLAKVHSLLLILMETLEGSVNNIVLAMGDPEVSAAN